MKNMLENLFRRSTNNALHRFYSDCLSASEELAVFAGDFSESCEFISLGENCSTAWYFKELDLKTRSYPFDWIFSSPEIAIDCIKTEFSSYLDRSLIEQSDDQKSAGHLKYHSSMFNHRSPLKSEEDYAYYKRCCERFVTQINSQQKTFFAITLINEPSKRKKWSQGFDRQFQMPEAQNIESTLPLINLLLEKNQNSKFLVIDHYTQSTRNIFTRRINDHVCLLSFTAKGNSNGVRYPNPLDDIGFKLALSGLANTREKA